MDFLNITIPELLKNADLQSAFLVKARSLGIKVTGTCKSCIVGYYQEYIKKAKMSKHNKETNSKYRVVNNRLVHSPYSTPISNANITNELVEKLLQRQPRAAAHFERVDGKPIGYKEPIEPEIDATKGAIEVAAEYGINLKDVEGTGKGGRITVGDIKALV